MKTALEAMIKQGRIGLLLTAVWASGCAWPFGAKKGPEGPDEWRARMQPSLTGEEAGRIAQGISLHEAIVLAVRRNPGVEAARRQWLAAIHREPQAITPDDPMLSELSYDFQMDIWSSVQPEMSVPWIQKLWARGKIAAEESDIARLQWEAAVRDLIIEVKDSYYELYYLDQASAITEKIEQMFRNDAVLAYQELNNGRAELGEAFRAESQAAQLSYDRLLLAEQRAAQAERLKSLLNLPPETPIGPARAAPVYPISERVEPLYKRAEQYAEVLKIRGLEIQRARHETFLARLSRAPDVTVGTAVSSLAGGLPTDFFKGDRSYMGMISFNLPIYEWRNRALVKEKKATEEMLWRAALEETNQVRQAVAKAYFEARSTGRLARLYAETLLPQAQAVVRQAEIDFRSDQSSFSNVIETTLAYHNFLLAYHRALADYGQAIGRLEQTLGSTAESRSGGGEE